MAKKLLVFFLYGVASVLWIAMITAGYIANFVNVTGGSTELATAHKALMIANMNTMSINFLVIGTICFLMAKRLHTSD